MESSFTLWVWYEMMRTSHDYENLTEPQVKELIDHIREMNAEPGIRNRALRYEVKLVQTTVVDSGVF